MFCFKPSTLLCAFLVVATAGLNGCTRGSTETGLGIGVEGAGQESSAIVDGHQANTAEISATVGLLGNFTCSGTLIAPRVVMTAAHCVVDGINGVDVYAGILQENNAGNANRYGISQSIPHPNYNANAWDPNDPDGLSLSNDIAILILDRDVTQAVPVPILPQARLAADLSGGEPLTLAGFGVTSENGNSSGTLYVTQTPFVRRSATELLAGGANQPDSCYGDSGGPAYRDVGGERFVVGVTSRGSSSGSPDCGNGGIYTLAPAFIPWINDVSGGLVDGTTPPPAGTDPEPDPVGTPSDASCLDRCDEFDEAATCNCDAECVEFDDCCPDIIDICVLGNTPDPEPIPEPTPDVSEPDAAQPDATEPDASEPDASEPDVTEPDAAEPDVATPDASEPDAAEPDASEPDASEPDAAQPDASQPDPVAVGPEGGVTDPEAEAPGETPPNSAGAINSRPRLSGGCSQTSSSGLTPFALLALVLLGRRRRRE